MRIAFYHDDGAPPADLPLMQEAFAAAGRHCPAASLVHLTNKAGPETPQGAERLEVTHDGTFAERRCFSHVLAHARWPGEPLLFLDTDCHLAADVSEVWEEPFDVAAALMERPLHPTLPCNSGVVFSRSIEFWVLLYQRNRGIDWRPGNNKWVALETNFNNLLYKPRFRVSYVHGRVYNHIPEGPDAVAADAKIIHWKGYRKDWWLKGRA